MSPRSALAIWLLALLCVPRAALAQDEDVPAASGSPPSGPHAAGEDRESVAAYCQAVEASAAASGALLRSPWLFGTAGSILGSERAADVETAPEGRAVLRLRVQAGIGLSPTRMYRASLNDRLAQAECRRFKAVAGARRELQAIREGVLTVGPAALEAKAKVLAEALARAREFLAAVERRLDGSLATIDDYRALVSKVFALEASLHQAREAITVRSVAPKPTGNWASLAAQVAQTEGESAELESSLRTSQALEVVVRGGYDRVFGIDQEVPAFGSLMLRFSPGYFWQADANARAERASVELSRRRLSAELPEVQQARQVVSSRLAREERRASELGQAIQGLEARLAAIQAVPGMQAEHQTHLLWLDIAQLRAEHAYTSAQAEELRRALGYARQVVP